MRELGLLRVLVGGERVTPRSSIHGTTPSHLNATPHTPSHTRTAEVKGSVVSPVEEANTFTRNAGKWTVVAFLNSGSGGGMGKKILIDMVELLGEEYVFDLRSCKKGNMPEDKVRCDEG